MEFRELIEKLKSDSKNYHFCKEGVDGIARSMSPLQCCAFLRDNIVYCFDSDYHQVIAENIEEWYRNWKKEFNACGIWVNEYGVGRDKNLIIVTQTENIINSFTDNRICCFMLMLMDERCFIFGDKRLGIKATDHAKIYSKNPNALIHLYGHAHGFIKNSVIEIEDFATCYAENSKVMSDGRCRLFLTESCKWTDYNHKEYKLLEHLGFQ